jgi:hypothetical protein
VSYNNETWTFRVVDINTIDIDILWKHFQGLKVSTVMIFFHFGPKVYLSKYLEVLEVKVDFGPEILIKVH